MDVTLSPGLFAYVVFPLMIFFARICDVSLGTIRVIFVTKGMKYLAPLIGFFEVIIWLLAIGQVMNNVTSVVAYVAYGGGFAAGTYIGMALEEKISLGLVVVRTIAKEEPAELVRHLWSQGYGVTSLDGEGVSGPVKVVLSIVKRHDLPSVIASISKYSPGAFYTVEEVKSVSEGIFPPARQSRGILSVTDAVRWFRK